jgi:drug/metabolite transporter (DMT)-like permease
LWYNQSMNLTEATKGELFKISGSVLGGLSPVVVVLGLGHVGPLVSLSVAAAVSAIFFAVIMLLKNKWHELLLPGVLKEVLFAALIIGVCYYSLYFLGLKYTSPGNVALIALSEVFFSFLFFNIWKKEEFTFPHILGSLLMLMGAAVVIFPQSMNLHIGDLFILLAAAIVPFGNYFQQRLRKRISSASLMFGRSLITLPFVVIVAFLFKEEFSFIEIGRSFWFLLFNGIVLLGVTKILWLEAIHRISVTKAAALGCLTPIFTLLFAYVFLKQPPTLWQFVSFAPLAVGLVLLTYKKPPTDLALVD